MRSAQDLKVQAAQQCLLSLLRNTSLPQRLALVGVRIAPWVVVPRAGAGTH
jgi:hypothetical protein